MFFMVQRYGDRRNCDYGYARIIYQFRRFFLFLHPMRKILRIDNPNDYAEYVGAPVLHPQLALISFDEVSPFRISLNNYGVYGLFIQRHFPENLSYGTKSILVGDSSIIAVAPGQIGGAEDNGVPLFINGWALLWSAELLSPDNPFFSYFYTEALRMNSEEWERITSLLRALRKELQQNEDSEPLRGIMTGYLRLILSYCERIHLRQLSCREDGGNDLLKRFHRLLEEYFSKGLQYEKGIPTVAYCASELAYSARYFGDMVHAATGGTAIGYIHDFVIGEAKNLLMKGLSVNDTADVLGFGYPHHFSRLFKKKTGLTPTEFIRR